MVTKSTSSASVSNTSNTNNLKSTKSTAASSFKIQDISMNNLINQIKKADKDLDTILSKQPIILKLERQSGIKKTQMVYGLAALAVFFLLYRFATSFVVAMVLLAYPMFMSLEAVESHDKAKDAHILSYWSVIALVQMTEAVFPFIRRFVPFYNILKLIFAVYMYLPQTKVNRDYIMRCNH